MVVGSFTAMATRSVHERVQSLVLQMHGGALIIASNVDSGDDLLGARQ